MSKRGTGQISARRRALIEQGTLSGSYPMEELLADVRALADFDELNALGRKSALRWMVISILAFVVCLVITLAAVPELLPFTLALLVSAIYFGTRLRKHGRLDISDNLRKTALPFLSVLKQDVAAGEQIQVQLDLAPPTHARKRIGESPSYARGAYDRIVDTHYRDEWFVGSARFVDGTLVRWRVTDEVRVSKRSKTNLRGKRKTKIRHAKQTLVEVTVGLLHKAYRVEALKVQKRPDLHVTLTQADKRAMIKVQHKLKKKSLEPIDPELLIDAISCAYRSAESPQGSAA